MDYISKYEKPNALIKELGLVSKTAVERFYEKPCSRTLKNVPKLKQTYDMIKLAVSCDGLSIHYASKKLIDEEIYKIAVSQNGEALDYVPEKYKTKQLCLLAVGNNGTAINYVPETFLSDDLYYLAVQSNGLALEYIPLKYISKELCESAVKQNGLALKFVPPKFINKGLCLIAIDNNALSVQYIPKNKLNKNIVIKALSNIIENDCEDYPIKYIPAELLTEEMIYLSVKINPHSVKNIPGKYYTQQVFDMAFSENNDVFYYIPDAYITKDMCLKKIEGISDFNRYRWVSRVINKIPFIILNQRDVLDAVIEKVGIDDACYVVMNKKGNNENDCLSEDNKKYITVKYEEKKNHNRKIDKIEMFEVETSSSDDITSIVEYDENNFLLHELSNNKEKSKKIYYISDIHIEHQMKDLSEEDRVDNEKVVSFLTNKITEMLSFLDEKYGIILIGGDVGHTPSLVRLFYKLLSKQWNGIVISVLGNHELWNGHVEMDIPEQERLSADEVVSIYKNYCMPCFLLHNEMFIVYKRNQRKIIKEEQILTASEEELYGVFKDCSLIILGGIGFSGDNEYFNAERGLYRSTVTTRAEDEELRLRFNRVYEKISHVANEYRVIVLTHNPVKDWTKEPCNHKWIYINGHTHRNTIIRKEDGTTVLSDNQVGYKPVKWKLNCFTIEGWTDPFSKIEDGIHKITSEMYADFYRERGIWSDGCNYSGTIYMIKRNNIYMFLLESDYSLCLLSGGRRKSLTIENLQYYYDNLEIYYKKVVNALAPYYQTINAIASEVKLFGGEGYVHGCIVDIDYFNHLYLNPYDGKITAYWAENKINKITYSSVTALIRCRKPELKIKLDEAMKNGKLPILKNNITKRKKKNDVGFFTVPKMVLETDIYEPSAMMRAVQYIFENNVVRVWNDEILELDNGTPELSVTDDNPSDDDYFYSKANTEYLDRSIAQLNRSIELSDKE